MFVKALLGINNRSSTPNGLGKKGYLLTQLKNLGVYCLNTTRLTCSENVIRTQIKLLLFLLFKFLFLLVVFILFCFCSYAPSNLHFQNICSFDFKELLSPPIRVFLNLICFSFISSIIFLIYFCFF